MTRRRPDHGILPACAVQVAAADGRHFDIAHHDLDIIRAGPLAAFASFPQVLEDPRLARPFFARTVTSKSAFCEQVLEHFSPTSTEIVGQAR